MLRVLFISRQESHVLRFMLRVLFVSKQGYWFVVMKSGEVEVMLHNYASFSHVPPGYDPNLNSIYTDSTQYIKINT